MIIKTLSENTSVSDAYGAEHGLSLYLETASHKALFDTGKSDLFLENAETLGVDLSLVDIAFLSHGHYDHGGGLQDFFRVNGTAKLYLQKETFGAYYAMHGDKPEYVGLDQKLQNAERLYFTDGFLEIDSELSVFSGVTAREFTSSANNTLLVKEGEHFSPDSFTHEQNLIVREKGKVFLFAGCAHNGIVNITERFHTLFGNYPDAVIGGFHLYNPSNGKTEEPELIYGIGERLLKTGAQYYTCHCTGPTAFEQLQRVMGEKIGYLSAGSVVEF